jgi:hypothetical protein
VIHARVILFYLFFFVFPSLFEVVRDSTKQSRVVIGHQHFLSPSSFYLFVRIVYKMHHPAHAFSTKKTTKRHQPSNDRKTARSSTVIFESSIFFSVIGTIEVKVVASYTSKKGNFVWIVNGCR